MDAPDNFFSDLVGWLKSWIPWRSEPSHVSRDFWMPDQSCRVCYECDSQFTLVSRRHHCRHCGLVFCAKCTANWVPAPSSDPRTAQEDWEKIRVCNFCFKQWEQGLAAVDNGAQVVFLDLSTSPSAASSVSTKSSSTVDSSSVAFASVQSSVGSYQYSSVLSPCQSVSLETVADTEGVVVSGRSNDYVLDTRDPSANQFGLRMDRSDEEDDEFGVYQLRSKTGNFPQFKGFYGQVEFDDVDHDYRSHEVHADEEANITGSVSSSSLHNSFDSVGSEGFQQLVQSADDHNIGDACEAPSSLYAAADVDAEPVDFENNGLLWLPPEPEDEEDEREALLFDEDDEDDATGDWGYLCPSSSFGSGEHQKRDRSNEEHKKAVKNVVDGHFRALVAQLLQVENLPLGEEEDKESWLEIITSLSWEAATLLKPDMSRGGGMDPGGYVKIKCLASGHRSESMVVRGVVCKKNVAHRRMTSRIEKPRLLILGGALEYQRVSNLLSSFDTLLQQEMDHLKMAVAKIDAQQPDVLLVEKSVSRFAQDYLLAKNISLVLNIKRSLLERIARCTGAQIVPSIDHLSSQKLGFCDMFHVERFLEEHGSAGEGGKKLVKTLMYFEGCPKPLGCTILLRGAKGDDFKKVKHVLRYGVFAAYHLALETSFLADEGASLPELPFNSPITVALPDKPSIIDRSISTIPGFTIPAKERTPGPPPAEPQRSNSVPASNLVASVPYPTFCKTDNALLPSLLEVSNSQNTRFAKSTAAFSSIALSVQGVADSCHSEPSPCRAFAENSALLSREHPEVKISAPNSGHDVISDELINNGFGHPEAVGLGVPVKNAEHDSSAVNVNQRDYSQVSSLQQDVNLREEPGSSKEEFPPTPSDHQSILVSLSSRCVWNGIVCERSHLFRIKYYGNFDKPLGRFLRDHLFDQCYRCRSCDMPSEAHVHCYTHQQGTLTISVKKLQDFLLPGEREGKIWMWHRCLRCPRINGFPPATRRVVMSDAAWGLSFGKFLELSFSNHAAASRVATCGHSLHRDCLRFYGFGKMVACFRYASIDVHSVYLPPAKLDFNYENQDWIRDEKNEVVHRAELLFTEVLNALSRMAEKWTGTGLHNSSMIISESRHQIAELEVMLQREKAEFEESLRNILDREVKKGQPIIDILEINRLRRQLLAQSYMWDHRLIYAATLDSNSLQDDLSSSNPELLEKISCANGHLFDVTTPVNKPGIGADSVLVKLTEGHNLGGGLSSHADRPKAVHQGTDLQIDSRLGKENQGNLSAGMNSWVASDPLESNIIAHRTISDGKFPITASLSETLDAAWIGENLPGVGLPRADSCPLPESVVADSSSFVPLTEKLGLQDNGDNQSGSKVSSSPPLLSIKDSENMEDSISWLGMPFINFYRSLNKNILGSVQKLETLGDYNPVYVSSIQKLELQGGGRLLLPVGTNDSVVPVYDDEPTSIISYALVSPDYLDQLSDDCEKTKDSGESTVSLQLVDSGNLQYCDEMALESSKSLGSTDDGILSRSSSSLDPLSYTKTLHARVSFTDDGPQGKVKYSVTCYYAKRFEALRRICCPSEMDFIRSLSRCKKWGAQGGKSNVFFAKSFDDRFIIKQVTKTELESFIKFAPEYFKYLSESIGTRSPTCLAKILGVYQVTSKHLKGGKESKIDVLVMENLLFGRNLTRLYDLKGSSRSRYNPDSSGSNRVLLDQNLIEAMPTSPIFVGNKAKRLLERAVWNDTSFLASVDVMDYSLLVGVDEDKHELVLGIIDFMRQYTWDKHLETWVKASGILGGSKNASPTVISPKQYKKRFRKAMTTYFLMVPDQWSPPTIIPSKSLTDLFEENSQRGTSRE